MFEGFFVEAGVFVLESNLANYGFVKGFKC